MDWEIIVAFIVGGTLLATGLIAFAIWSDRKRTEAFQEIARQLGFEYFARGDGGLAALTQRFDLMNRGRNRRFRNVMSRTADGKTVHLCDYQYTTGSGKNSSTHHQSLAIIDSPDLNLPAFTLAPENFLHRFGQMLGMQDIDFDTAPEFSRKYVLRGANEPAIREFFTAERLEQFPEFGPINVAGDGSMLMVWFSRRVKPDGIRDFFETAFKVHLLLSS